MAYLIDNDIEEFVAVLTKVAVSLKMSGAVFKDNYFIFLNENWKPWHHFNDDLFKKSFIVCLSDNKEKHSTLIKSNISTYESKHMSLRKESTANISSDYTGSPLEYVFDVTDVFTNDKTCPSKKNLVHLHNPLAITDARYLCVLYNKMLELSAVSDCIKDIPLFVYCDGKDLSHISLMGVSKNYQATIVNKGAVTEKLQFPTMVAMKKEHLQCFPITFTEVETNVYSQFDVTGSCTASQKAETLKPATQGQVSIECTSSDFKNALEKPLTDSSCLLLVQAVAGNEHEGAHNRFKELQFIKALCDSLVTGEIAWPNKNAGNIVSIKLKSFLDGLKQSRTTYKIKETKSNEPNDFDSTFIRYVTSERDDMDFTDHLWHILQDCNSYEDLVEAFTFCFSELRNFPFMPYVYRTNTTTIGRMIRNEGVQNLSNLDLEGIMPLKLLLELGIEKLMKDYVMIFVGLEMVSYDFLTPYLNENKLSDTSISNSNLAMIMERIVKCLEKFHTVEELLIILWSYLRSSKAELNGFVRMVLRHYATVSAVDPSHVFKFPISLCSVKHIVGKEKPIIWQASLRSRDSDFEKQSILRICKKLDAADLTATTSFFSTYFISGATFISSSSHASSQMITK